MAIIQFSTTNAVGSRLIRTFTWSHFSHVDVVLKNGDLFGALAERGVCQHSMQRYARVKRYRVDVDAKALVDALFSQLGKPYDWGGVLGLGLRHNWQDDNKWFCSELMAWAFMQAGAPLLNTEDSYRITPRDLELSPLLLPLVSP